MKVAIIKLGSRISISANDSSGGTGETLSIIKLLTTAGVEVDAYTKILSRDIEPDYFKTYDIIKELDNINKRNYDALLVLNGNVNYFGGVDCPDQTLNYKIINSFTGKVFYIHCDGNLYLKQVWPSISKKTWASNYNKEDIEIIRDDIVYITQSHNTDLVLEKARKCNINIKSAVYFPFEKFPMVNDPSVIPFNDCPEYDLLYGGTFRNGRREEDMIKFYFGYDSNIKVAMFGKITHDNFTKNKNNDRFPDFEKSIDYKLFKDKMNKSIATVIIGDKIYKKQDDLAQRIYESILSSTVTLIDSSYDWSTRVFKNKELVDFCYVSSRKDVEDRLNKLKNIEFRKKIVELQLEDTKFDILKYCTDFINLLK